MHRTLEWYVHTLGRKDQDAFFELVRHPVLVDAFAYTGGPQTNYSTQTDALVDGQAGLRDEQLGRREVYLVRKHHGRPLSQGVDLGRTLDHDICVARQGISRFHALFSEDGPNAFQITDKGSKNGTYLEGVRLAPGVPAPLGPSATVRFASYSFRFMVPHAFYEMVRAAAAAR